MSAAEPARAANTTLKFDRRSTRRAPATGTAMAAFFAREGTSLTSVAMSDTSPGGVGIISPVQAAPGCACSLFPHSARALPRVGVVVRCTLTPRGYRVGLRIAARHAA